MEAEPAVDAAVGAAEAVETPVEAPMVSEPAAKYRKDYQAPAYLVETVTLHFDLREEVTTVQATINFKPSPGPSAEGTEPSAAPPLVLDGHKDVRLVSIKVDGELLDPSGYAVTDQSLTITSPPSTPFVLVTVVEVKPQHNTELAGLYKSGGNFCTQCEAEGFRSITYFPDRPDVMSVYTTRVEADKASYPVLLSNGNLVESGDLEDGRHFTVWQDPFPKPCYLFALVAGKLASREREFTTRSGRKVQLRIFVQEHNVHQVEHAMESLLKAMRWDEETFGLEYDLDQFNIVAVDDFNMGAMENKSLNIFNSRMVLALPTVATDADYLLVERVVAHEYFHNWTGNRVTCRDWFQLTLKEGLTVYRDQEFTADMNSRPVKRIEDTMFLRSTQFSEDAGAMAHPVRPDSYVKMDNFYTSTVYKKGAEVVRLFRTLLGKDGFRKGMDLYFERHDGQAVSCDDFRAALADANGADLAKFDRWYSQAGTPQVKCSSSYNAASRTFHLTVSQHTPPTPGQPNKLPLPIPFCVGLLGPDGKDMPMTLQGQEGTTGTTAVLLLEDATKTFVFTGVDAEPVPSLLRGFSAPVKMTVEGQTDEQLIFLFANDSDSFNRWDAGQRLAKKLLLSLYEAGSTGEGPLEDRLAAAGGVPDSLADAYRKILTDKALDGSFQAMAVTLPSSTELIGEIPQADPVLVHQVCQYVLQQLASRLRPELEALVKANDVEAGTPYVFNAQRVARRAIKNQALALLSVLEDPEVNAQLLQRCRDATNMTDKMAGLSSLVEIPGPEREAALGEFYESNQTQPLVVLKWIALQAASDAPDNVQLVKQLLEHPAFVISNPNSCYAMLLNFPRSAVNFHNIDGSGYEFLADIVIQIDRSNPQVAARVCKPFTTFKSYDAARQALIRAQLERMAAVPGLSANVCEIVSKSLAS